MELLKTNLTQLEDKVDTGFADISANFTKYFPNGTNTTFPSTGPTTPATTSLPPVVPAFEERSHLFLVGGYEYGANPIYRYETEVMDMTQDSKQPCSKRNYAAYDDYNLYMAYFGHGAG